MTLVDQMSAFYLNNCNNFFSKEGKAIKFLNLNEFLKDWETRWNQRKQSKSICLSNNMTWLSATLISTRFFLSLDTKFCNLFELIRLFVYTLRSHELFIIISS